MQKNGAESLNVLEVCFVFYVSCIFFDPKHTESHFCSETALTEETALIEETRFHCEIGCIPGMRTADPLDGKQTVDPLDQ